jgi:acyl-CoA hydrolase
MSQEEIQNRIEASKTSLFKVVFPNTTNHYDTLFGGNAMYLMDEVAFITATRFSRKRVVTISSSRIDFTEPIPADTIIELQGKVVRIGNTSLDVEVLIYQEEMYNDERKRSIKGLFTFVAIDQKRKPVSIT